MSKAERTVFIPDDQMKVYLQSIQCLIFESSNSAKNMITAALRDLGMPIQNIHFSKSYDSALDIARTEKPKLFISEYEVRGRFGLELLYDIKDIVPEPIFILATSTASETSVAEAAEEDVDAYIVKPFMGEQLLYYIRQAISYRIDPPPYIAKIKEGKKAFEGDDLAEAKRFFFEASTIGEKPSLAFFYLGQINEKEDELEQALELYEDGLTYVPIHYKCMTAKFEALDKLKKPNEAYSVVKEILKHYPVTPQRLGRMIYLAMVTKHFTDVEEYYNIYQRLENRTEKLQVIVRAALFTTGKYLLQEKQFDRASSLFEKAVLCSKRDNQVILKSIEELLKSKQIPPAEHILSLIAQESMTVPEAQQAEFRVVHAKNDRSATTQLGMKIIDNDCADEFIFDSVIQLLKLEGSDRIAEKYIQIGSTKFPNLKKYI
ncbi:MAG: response regulator [Bdellovibrionales bacterium]|nr:response regulator [Bdellovibrionales bacterium]